MDETKDVTYTIVDGDTAKFAIDEQSGVITTREELDFERQQAYQLIVSTRQADDNNPQYSATVQITVLVSITLLALLGHCKLTLSCNLFQ